MLKHISFALTCTLFLGIPVTSLADSDRGHDNDRLETYDEGSGGAGDLVVEIQFGNLDVDNDGVTTNEDERLIVECILDYQSNGTYYEPCDLTGDSAINLLDLQVFWIALSDNPAGGSIQYDLDAEDDGEVGVVDWFDEFLLIGSLREVDNNYWNYVPADINVDGQLNNEDLRAWWQYAADNGMEYLKYDIGTEDGGIEGVVNEIDEFYMIDAIQHGNDFYLTYLPADMNLDGEYTTDDLGIWWQYATNNGLEYIKYDISNADEEDPGTINWLDEYYIVDAIQYGNTWYTMYLAADLNLDGQYTIADLGDFWAYMHRTGRPFIQLDIDGDGGVDLGDRAYIEYSATHGLYFPDRDMNLDGSITSEDLSIWDMLYNFEDDGPPGQQ